MLRYDRLVAKSICKFIESYKDKIVKFDDLETEKLKNEYILTKSYSEYYKDGMIKERINFIWNNLDYQKKNHYSFYMGDRFRVPDSVPKELLNIIEW